MCWWVALREDKLDTPLFLSLLSLGSTVGVFLLVFVCLFLVFFHWISLSRSPCGGCCCNWSPWCVRVNLQRVPPLLTPPGFGSANMDFQAGSLGSGSPAALISAVTAHNTRGVTAKCRWVLCVISGARLAGAFMEILSGNDSNTKINST